MIEINGRSVPTTIEDLVDPARTAVVVVDMQNDFCSVGGSVEGAGGSLEMFGPAIERMHALLAGARAARVPIVHVRMLTQPGGYTDSAGWMRVRVRAARSYGGLHEGAAWEYTTPGSWGADFAPGFEPHGDEPVVDKFRSSAFFGTNLDTILRTLGVDNVVVIGCTTEGCVDSTVRDAGFRDYVAVVPEDAVASDVRELHDAAMTIFRAYRADVVSAAEILAVWA